MSALFYVQPLFATYALKWKDYYLILISIRYLGCFVFVLCHFALWKNPARFSTIKKPASRNINTGKANQITFLKGVRLHLHYTA